MVSASRWRVVWLRCGLLVLGFLTALGIVEIALRLAGVSYPAPYLPDEHTGSRLQPGWSGWFRKEGGAFVTINSAGFRDREHPLDKPANTFRILVLGDSYVEAVQVPQQATFWSVLERQLQPTFAPRGKEVEVIAMGVSGWGTGQEYLALKHYGFAYQPDLVVLAFLPANDLRNNSKVLEGDATRPYFRLDQENLQLDDSFRSDPQFLKVMSRGTAIKVALINHSRILQLIQESRARWKQRALVAQEEGNAGLDDRCFLEPKADDWKDAWTVTERLIERMHDDSQQHGARFCILVIPHSTQVHPDATQRQAFQQQLGVKDLSYSDRRIREVGQRVGFPVVVLSEPMCEYAAGHGEYLHGFANTNPGEGHWNAIGHRVAGETLANRLKTEWFGVLGELPSTGNER